MHLRKLLLSFVVAAPALLAASHATHADQPGRHPALLHALSDLRAARGNLERRGGDRQDKWDESRAIGAIDAAIGKIKAAAIDDGKNLQDHPPVDQGTPRSGLMHNALALLDAAHRDVGQEEDDAFAQGLKHRALGDIDFAQLRVREGLCNAGDQSFCPH